MTENALDSFHYVNWGNKATRRNLPESVTYPRKCYCGYHLKPGEYSVYVLGRWACKMCCQEERVGWEVRQ